MLPKASASVNLPKNQPKAKIMKTNAIFSNLVMNF